MNTIENQPSSQQLLPKVHNRPPQILPRIYLSEAHKHEDEEFDLSQVLPIVRRRSVLIAGVTTGVTAVVGIWSFTQTPEYEGKFQLLLEPMMPGSQGNNLLPIDLKSKMPAAGLDYESQIQVLWSPKVMSPIIEQLQARYKDMSYDSLFNKEAGKNQLLIQRYNKTKIIEVRYRNLDKGKINFVLEKVAQGYVNYSIDDRKTSTREGINFIEKQLPDLRRRVDEQQRKLLEFRQQFNIINLQIQGEQLSERVIQIQNQRVEAETTLNQQRSLYTMLQQRLGLDPDDAIAAAALTQAPRYQQLLNKLKEIETKIAIESARFHETSPTLRMLREQQQNLIPLLNQEAQQVLGKTGNIKTLPFQDSIRLNLAQQLINTANTILVQEVRLNATAEAERQLNEQVSRFPSLVREHSNLEAELNIATDTLKQLLTQREVLRVEAAQQEVPWELISLPEIMQDMKGMPVPVSPKLPITLALGGAAGLLLGAGAAALAERLNNVFHTTDDLKNSLSLPLLGMIPYSEQTLLKPLRGELAEEELNSSHLLSPSFFQEAFRLLYTKFRFLKLDKRIRSLVISSATSGDGKSTVALNLAKAAAVMGQRVLLVDANLRRPQIHTQLGLAPQKGLSDVISSNIQVNNVIIKSQIEENLWVLTAGKMLTDAPQFLSSKNMQYLMNKLKSAFDLVIYDAPPLLNVADSKFLAANTDGLILVVRMGKTNRTVLTQVLDRLSTGDFPVLGVIANEVRKDSLRMYDRYYKKLTKTRNFDTLYPMF
ncbi:polysaccharide biosynthesis tyrosine autokinase [Microcoleus sp. FACHB-68]|uniref:GumC family protein n=1 Tax=Microcoleus sp. FACHB-68 TaxID=2692826 RepID=UPI0016893F2C|nr:polysaccharide biosynthesis tyrosine autokinase [Microcoleus sp. FACHB-68]MBD1937390.1 polysaccharide biosynthesis tyrosine autokinase [Microcoleus sp. FACHB-68]